jgi:hypothetical protein
MTTLQVNNDTPQARTDSSQAKNQKKANVQRIFTSCFQLIPLEQTNYTPNKEDKQANIKQPRP